MTVTKSRGISRRNAMLAAAALSLCLGLLSGFHPWLALVSLGQAMVTFLVAGSGFFAALGIREFARLAFDLEDKPWYGQRGAVLYLMCMLAATNAACVAAFGSFLRIGFIASCCPLPGLLFSTVAAQLVFIALLDWPRSTSERDEREAARFSPVSNSRISLTPPADFQSYRGIRGAGSPGANDPSRDIRHGETSEYPVREDD